MKSYNLFQLFISSIGKMVRLNTYLMPALLCTFCLLVDAHNIHKKSDRISDFINILRKRGDERDLWDDMKYDEYHDHWMRGIDNTNMWRKRDNHNGRQLIRSEDNLEPKRQCRVRIIMAFQKCCFKGSKCVCPKNVTSRC